MLALVEGTGKTVTGAREDMAVAAGRRGAPDRRVPGWRTVFYGFLRSRRRGERRRGEPAPVFVDWHHPWLFFLAVAIMLLSTLDAFFTLELLQRGAIEVNPVMALAIESGTAVFAGSKMLLTGAGLLTLAFLARAPFLRRFRAGQLLTGFFAIYATLVCYQFVSLVSRM